MLILKFGALAIIPKDKGKPIQRITKKETKEESINTLKQLKKAI